MIFEVTPSQTVGPYFAIGLPFEGGNQIVPEGTPGAIRITGTIYDGRGEVVPDHLIEFWQPDAEGRFADIHGYGEQSTLEGFRGFGRSGWRTATAPTRCSPSSRGGCPGPNGHAAGAAHRRDPVRARDAEPRRDAHLLRRRGRGQRHRPGARDRSGRPPQYSAGAADRRTATASTSTSRAPERPSSLTSDALFAGTYARGGAAEAVTAEAWVRAMVDAEVALAAACVAEGLIPPQAGEAIVRAAAAGAVRRRRDRRRGGRARDPGDRAGARAARARSATEFADAVHLGATSQDIIDTAAMLVSAARARPDPGRRARRGRRRPPDWPDAPRHADARTHAAAAGAADLLRAGGGRMAGRPASAPRSSSSACAMSASPCRWAARSGAGRRRSRRAWPPRSAWPSLCCRGIRTAPASRSWPPRWAGWRARRPKVARDITLLAQAEVGEVREGGEGRGGSSSMPHKHNPVAAVSVLACAQRVPGLVATLFAGDGAGAPARGGRVAGRVGHALRAADADRLRARPGWRTC